MLIGHPPAEIRNLPKAECERLIRLAWKRVAPFRWLFLGVTLLALPVILVLDDSNPLGAYLPISMALAPWLTIAMLLSILGTTLVFVYSVDRLFRESLRQQMLEEGIRPQGCLSCHCDFGELNVRSCPQCGTVVFVAARERVGALPPA